MWPAYRKEEPVTDFQAIADRVEIEALRAEFSDAVMMRDRPRLASLFTHDGVLRMPNVPAEMTGREEIRVRGEQLQTFWEFFVQTTNSGVIELDGDTASGRAFMHELMRLRDGSSHVNYAIYHDRYQRTPEGWKFAERVYEVRYADDSPLAGSAPGGAGGAAMFGHHGEALLECGEHADGHVVPGRRVIPGGYETCQARCHGTTPLLAMVNLSI